MKTIKKLTVHPALVSYPLLWLIVLVVVGTVDQKYIGLYLSGQKYFSSFYYITSFGLPLPGGYTTCSVLLFGLFVKTFFASEWSKKKLGINLVHIGAILLIGGGAVTAFYSKEGALLVREGENSNILSDYHKVELSLLSDGETFSIPESDLKQEASNIPVNINKEDFNVEIVRFFRNCQITPIKVTDPKTGQVIAVTGVTLKELERDPMEEENRACASIKINEQEFDIYEFMPKQKFYNNYEILLRHEETALPFYIKLDEFKRELYPGTNQAKEYSSQVVLQDGSLNLNSLISMNEPLIYNDYTLYQASFVDKPSYKATVLAVVQNKGKWFPYIATIVICLGLLVHLFIMLPKMFKK